MLNTYRKAWRSKFAFVSCTTFSSLKHNKTAQAESICDLRSADDTDKTKQRSMIYE